MRKYTLTFIFLIIFSIPQVNGQGANYTLISMEDGLPSNNVYSVIKDKKGYLWFATDRGVAKYDGYEMKVFTTKDGLITNDIWELWEDSQGRIWLYCFTKESQYIENNKVKLAFTKSNKNNIQYHREKDSVIYTGNNKYLYTFKNNTFHSFPHTHDSLTIKRSVVVFNDFNIGYLNKYYNLDEIVNFRTQKRIPIHRKEPNKLKRDRVPRFFSKDSIFYKFDNSDPLNTSLNYHNFKTNKHKTFNISQIWKNDRTGAKTILHKDGIQIISQYGYLILDEELNLIKKYEQEDIKLSKNDFVLENESGDLIISKKDVGVYITPNNRRSNNHFSFNNSNISYINESPDGKILVGLNNGRILIQDENKNGFSSYIKRIDKVINIKFDKDKIWVYDQNKVSLYNQNLDNITKKQKYIHHSALSLEDHSSSKKYNLGFFYPQHEYKAIAINSQLNWVSFTFGSAMCQIVKHISPDTIETTNYNINRQYATAISNDSIIWMGSSSGLKYIYKDSIIDLSLKNTIFSKNITKIIVDKSQNIWVGTDGFGIYVLDRNKTPYTIEGIQNDIIIDLIEGENGDIWISTNTGIKQIKIISTKPFTTSLGQHYTKSNGLASTASSKIFVKDSLLYAGSVLGLDIINYKNINNTHPSLYIESLSINNKKIPLKDKYDLDYQLNNIKINYSGISFKSKKGLKYHYYINNLSQDTVITRGNSIQLENLKPGNYKINIWAQDFWGYKSQSQYIQINIQKPWYNTIIFYLILSALLIVFIYLIVKYFTDKAYKKENISKKIAQLELHSLQSQMNPHFLFNAINAIQEYLYENDKEKVESYFTDFAKLMRLYLEASRTKSISLTSEITMLKLYIKLEKLRFKEKFTATFNIDEDLYTDNIHVPTMLIQPFVENAINHGIFHKKSSGKLMMKFYTENDHLHIIVEDNGIGRVKAQRIKEKSILNYKSRALEITDERINILKESLDLDISIKTTDLYKDDKAIGTRILITIPLDF